MVELAPDRTKLPTTLSVPGELPGERLPFVQTKDRRFPTSSAPAFAANSFGSKVAFIHLDVSDKWPGFLDRQFHDLISK
jgi:hypothetical protein